MVTLTLVMYFAPLAYFNSDWLIASVNSHMWLVATILDSPRWVRSLCIIQVINRFYELKVSESANITLKINCTCSTYLVIMYRILKAYLSWLYLRQMDRSHLEINKAYASINQQYKNCLLFGATLWIIHSSHNFFLSCPLQKKHSAHGKRKEVLWKCFKLFKKKKFL